MRAEIGAEASESTDDPVTLRGAGAPGEYVQRRTQDGVAILTLAGSESNRFGPSLVRALDQALASGSLTGQVTGITEWHINSLEPSFLGYSSQFNDPAWCNGSDPYSASDHDPLLIGLQLDTTADMNLV